MAVEVAKAQIFGDKTGLTDKLRQDTGWRTVARVAPGSWPSPGVTRGGDDPWCGPQAGCGTVVSQRCQ